MSISYMYKKMKKVLDNNEPSLRRQLISTIIDLDFYTFTQTWILN